MITAAQQAYGARYRAANKKKINDRRIFRAFEVRSLVFSHYGTQCNLCPETRLGALGLDHINGGGKQHRNEIGAGNFYRWVRDHDFPEEYRTLCSNCNVLAYLKSLADKGLSSTYDAIKLRKRYAAIKLQMITALGGRCVVCLLDDIRILTVHHVNGDGAQHRRAISNGRSGRFFYRAVLKIGDLTGLECRCFSCNDAANWGGPTYS